MSPWRFRGHPHYLNQQCGKLGITQILVDRARHNREIQRVSKILAQLAERFHGARRDEHGEPAFYPTELLQVSGSLEECERENFKLHALAAAASQMIDEAYAAYRIDQPRRRFGVVGDVEPPSILPLTNGDPVAGKTKAKTR